MGVKTKLMVLVVAVSVMSAASVLAADWPQFRGPNRDGKSAEKGLLTQWPDGGPKLLWSVDDIGSGFGQVAVVDGRVYVTGLVEKEGILRAYSLDGKPQWQARYGPEYAKSHSGARTAPTVHDGLVYVVSAFGALSCFDAAEGKQVWSVDLFKNYEARPVQWGYSENVLIDGDNVLVTPSGKKATMVALNRKTGKEVWASPSVASEANFCSPLLVEHGKKRMIVTMTVSAVVAFSAEDGKVLWQHPYKNARRNHCVTPIYHKGFLYITSGYGKGAIGLELAEDGGSVREVWQQRKQDPVHGQAVLIDGHVYASSHKTINGRWSCVELKTGKLTWQDPGVGKGGSVIYADGMLYCYAESGEVGLVRPSPAKCEVVSTFKVPLGDGSHWAHPVVAGGRLFIRHGNALMCYDVSADSAKPKPATAPGRNGT